MVKVPARYQHFPVVYIKRSRSQLEKFQPSYQTGLSTTRTKLEDLHSRFEMDANTISSSTNQSDFNLNHAWG
jgi:hypothetical protein